MAKDAFRSPSVGIDEQYITREACRVPAADCEGAITAAQKIFGGIAVNDKCVGFVADVLKIVPDTAHEWTPSFARGWEDERDHAIWSPNEVAVPSILSQRLSE